MALIGKIREKSILLVVIIGVALLAFILGNYDKMSGGYEDKYGHGTIYGDKVNQDKFYAEANKFKEQTARQKQQSQQPFTEEDEKAAEDNAWNYLVETTILEKEFDALGIDVSESEFDAYLYGKDGFTVLPDLLQSFADPMGRLDEKKLQTRINQMQNSSNPEEQKSWEETKKYYTEQRKREKYFSLLKQGIYVTKLESEEEYKAQKEMKNISYVFNRYFDIKDEDIKTNDEVLEKFFEEHKNEKKYQNPSDSREVKYFDIIVNPSKSDSSKFNGEIEQLKKNFAASTNDSVFVMQNSDVKFYTTKKAACFRPEGDPKAKQGMTYPKYMDTVFSTAVKGQLIGPYQDQGNTRLVKVIDFSTKSVDVRHILISAPKDDQKKIAAAQKKADSIVKLITKDNFSLLVAQFSEDPGAKQNNGLYEGIMEGDGYVPEFLDFAMTKAKGTIGTVKTDFGIHIMEVVDVKAVKYPVLAIVQKTLKASEETIYNIEDKVNAILEKIDAKISGIDNITKKIEMFDTIASKEGYMSRAAKIETNKPTLYGFNSKIAEDKILKLAYEEGAEVGDLCDAPIKDKNRYVIAIVSAIRTKGIAQYNDVKELVKSEYIKEQKAKRLVNKMLGKSLEKIAKENGSQVMKADVNFANPQITGAGYEPEVIGAIFSQIADGKRTQPLKGQNGVYVIKINKTTKAPATAKYDVERDQLLSSLRGSVMNQARQALMKKADVVDNRRFLSAGIQRD